MNTVLSQPNALAYVEGNMENPKLEGIVNFYQKETGVLVIARISGLPDDSGFFALHIHEGDSCEGDGFPETGGHYNPGNTPHPMHAGDLPPLLSNDGYAYMEVFTNRFTIDEIIGKTVIIHSGADDFTTQPSGNPGTKIACGVVIKI